MPNISDKYILNKRTFWDDEKISLTNIRKHGNAPKLTKVLDDGAGSKGIFLPEYTYETNVADEKQQIWEIQLTHRYKPGTDIHFHVHWTNGVNVGNGTQAIRWGLEYVILNNKASYDATSQIIYAEIIVPTSPRYVELNSLLVLPGSTLVESSMITGRLFRNSSHANDTFTKSVWAISFDAHIEVEKNGSLTQIPVPI